MNLLARDVWQEVREEFRAECGAAAAELWLQHLRPLGFARGVFTLGVPNDVVGGWVEHKYRTAFETIFRRLTGSAVRVLIRVEPEVPRPSLHDGVDAPVLDAGAEAVPRFVVRPENRLAAAAVQRVLREPASGNPLFLYGPAGCGKSLLVRTLLQRHVAEQEGRCAAASITAEGFWHDMVRAFRESRFAAFRGRMLAADVFVLEEAHRLRGKAKTQHEVLSVLRYHIERRRPVIVTSRHPPNAIFMLDEALRSYFLSGVLLRIADYTVPSRAAILEAHAERFPRKVPTETLERIAARVPGAFDRQVRFLAKVAGYAALLERPATLDLLAERFPELAGDGRREVNVGELIEKVAQEFGTTADDIASSRKMRAAVLARHLVVYLATEVYGLKARRVMRHLGGLSPSTTAYARRKIELRRKEDPVFDAQVRSLMERIGGGQKLLF